MPQKHSKYFFILFAGLLFAYTSIRAYKLSFTIDEGFSFIFYALDSYRNIFIFKLLDPNNHVLNSIGMKFFSSWLPLCEFTLRMQSLIAHIVYMIFTWLILRNFNSTPYRLAAWLLLNLHPFMLDFFSLARGYALSWAMLAGSLYFLKTTIENDIKKGFNILLCFIFGAFAVVASFPLLNYYIALMVVCGGMALYLAYEKKKLNISRTWLRIYLVSVLVISTLLLIYTFNITFKLQRGGFLYFGGNNGLWKDTAGSLIESTVFGTSYGAVATVVLSILAVILPAGSVLYVFARIRYYKDPVAKYAFFMTLLALLFIISSGLMMQHALLGTRFLLERAAIFILIIFIIILAHLLYYISPGKWHIPIALLIAALPLFHFARTANLSYFLKWKSEACTKEMMLELGRIHDTTSVQKEMFFQPEWLFATSTMFYQYLYHYSWMKPIESVKVFNQAEDYYYFPENALGELKGLPVEIVHRYALSHTVLLKNTDKKDFIVLQKKTLRLYDSVKANIALQKIFPMGSGNNINYVELKNGFFSPDIKFNASKQVVLSKIYVNAWARVFFPEGKCGDLIINIQDKAGKTLKWKDLGFDRYLLQKDGWMTIPFHVEIEKGETNVDRITISVWNTGDKAIYISDLWAEISRL
jgi:hypothetical protein